MDVLGDSYNFIRTVQPVGQGAFFTEKISYNERIINVVYDCGSTTKALDRTKIVAEAFEIEEIDVLFISHFHSDHVNMIPILKDHYNIKNVVLPLLSQDEILFLLSQKEFHMSSTDIISMIYEPEEYFGNNTRIIKVKRPEELSFMRERVNTPDEYDLSENKGPIEINSGDRLVVNKLLEYIPYYQPYNTDMIKNFWKLAEKYQEIQGKDVTPKIIRELRKVYREYATSKLLGMNGLNESSMLLFSGGIRSEYIYSKDKVFEKSLRSLTINMSPCYGCLYTGDSNMKKIDLNVAFGDDRITKLRIIQIPHHGSIHSINENCIIKDKTYFVSYGIKNKYHHPSKKVLDFLSKKKVLLYQITESSEPFILPSGSFIKFDYFKDIKNRIKYYLQ